MGPEGRCSDTEPFHLDTEQLKWDTSNVRAFQMVLNMASPGRSIQACLEEENIAMDGECCSRTRLSCLPIAHWFALVALPLWIPFSLDSCAPTVMKGFAMGFPQCNTEPQLESLTSAFPLQLYEAI